MSEAIATEWPPKEKIPDAAKPDMYYDAGRKDYLIKNNGGDWLAVSETSVRRHLIRAGIHSKREEGQPQSQLDERLTDIQLDNSVAYAGPLAGYSQGITTVCGQKILVTTSPNLIEPLQGDDKILQQVIREILGEEQKVYFLGWLKIAYEALRAGHHRPGQVLALAGKKDSGKSLLQNLITEMLGGRVAKPYRYMSGSTDFNGDLIGAEHLAIEDEIASTDIRMRRSFGARIKEFTVNTVQSCHHKNRPAISLTPFWRVSVSVNDEPENLQILPPLDESITDKILLFKVNQTVMPMPTGTHEERAAFWKALVAAIPAFMYNLTEWKIPEKLKCRRFGIIHYHHPDLIDSLSDLSPEMKLLKVLDDYLERLDNPKEKREFRGTAEDLELTLSELYKHETRRLFTWTNACGVYLGRLEKQHPDRVKSARSAYQRTWHITQAPSTPAEMTQ